MECVADEVFRIPLPLPGDALRAVNVYAIRTDRQVVLVDAGWDAPASWDALGTALTRLGSRIEAVRTVAVTHLHHDHVGQAARLRDTARAAVLIGAGEQTALEQILRDTDHGRARVLARLRRLGADALAAELERGDPQGADTQERARYEPPDVYLGDHSIVVAGGRALAVVPTPGHTRGHVCLWDEEHAVLFAGDHVLPHITPSIGLEPVPARLPLADFLASLARVRQLPARRVLPAHGPVFTDLGGRVDELVAHHERRLEQCLAGLDALGPAAVDAAAVAERLRWTRRELRLADLDWFNQMLAVGETAAHLDVLVERGAARRHAGDRVDRYQLGDTPLARPAPPAATAARVKESRP